MTLLTHTLLTHLPKHHLLPPLLPMLMPLLTMLPTHLLKHLLPHTLHLLNSPLHTLHHPLHPPHLPLLHTWTTPSRTLLPLNPLPLPLNLYLPSFPACLLDHKPNLSNQNTSLISNFFTPLNTPFTLITLSYTRRSPPVLLKLPQIHDGGKLCFKNFKPWFPTTLGPCVLAPYITTLFATSGCITSNKNQMARLSDLRHDLWQGVLSKGVVSTIMRHLVP
jgi:hypothetical protein